jgi:hypothetical protein
MAWIELHQNLPTNKKTLRLKKILKIKTPQAVGHLCMLWLWALDNAQDGDISEFESGEIAEIVAYPGDADKFMEALKSSGFVDENGHIHDWDDYAGKLIEQREVRKEQARIRQQNRRKKLSEHDEPCHAPVTLSNDDVTRDNGVSHAPTVPNPTAPYPTVPNPTVPSLNNPQERGNPENKTVGEEMRGLTIVGEAFENGVKDVVSSHDSETLLTLIKAYSVPKVLAAIEEAKKCKGHSVAYVKRVLEGWERDGKNPQGQSYGPDLTDPERYKNFGK